MDQFAWKILGVGGEQDEPDSIRSLLSAASPAAHRLDWVGTAEAGWDILQQEMQRQDRYDAVLLSADCEAQNNLDLVRKAAAAGWELPFILLCKEYNDDFHREATQAGATLCLPRQELNPLALELSLRHATESAQRQSQVQQELLSTIIQNMPNAVCLMRGNELYIEAANPAYQVFTSGEPLAGRTLEEVLPEADRGMAELCRRVLTTGEPYLMGDGIHRIRRSTDEVPETAYYNWSLNRIDLPGKKEQGVLFTAWETTTQKQVDETLLQSQISLARLVSTSYEGIWSVDQNGRTTFVNQRAAEILGYTLGEIQGRNAFEFLMSSEVGAGQETLARIAAGESGRVEAHARRKDSSEAILLVSYSPIFDEYGRFQGALAMFSDITDRKRTEKVIQETSKQLKSYSEMLETRVRERTEELVNLQRCLVDRVEAERLWVSQDLHDGPMQEIYALMYRIAAFKDLTDDPGMRAEITVVMDKLKAIIEGLRIVTRELRPVSLTPFGLERAIREYSERFDLEHPELRLSLDLMQDGQSIPEHIRLALFRIYQTALNNVIRHAQAKNVFVRLSLDKESIFLEIKDDGIGFEVPKRLRTLLNQGHFGLAGAAERTEAIGGNLQVESASGSGTRLRVWVPLRSEGEQPRRV